MGLHPVLAATLCIFASICTVAMATKSGTLHVTHYTHEVRGGPNRTLLLSAGTNSANLSAGVGFGSVVVFDNEIREGTSNSSKLLGRASGVAIGVIRPSPATKGATRVQMHMEHIFEEGSEYDGSTISVVGIFFSLTGPWEANVPGGTGRFKGYRGYGVSAQLSETAGPPPVYIVYKWDFYLTKEK
ncbi:hypothetical protein M758_10G049700 [Ceratodon purpureus]|uniref:Dirigent protein n=1 Tax=Ceratodon purpureus TaxID=3225 RepID=A0A8T0GKQ3_CERPU|nr:hypothetical protein KC19_10G053000 [Ceratodon purpureus]KAG0602895.1 hypothetical protein M758_10G049700 [Ceratodon purpureus]